LLGYHGLDQDDRTQGALHEPDADCAAAAVFAAGSVLLQLARRRATPNAREPNSRITTKRDYQ